MHEHDVDYLNVNDYYFFNCSSTQYKQHYIVQISEHRLCDILFG